MVKNFMSIADFSKKEIEDLLTVSSELKERLSRGVSCRVLDGQTLALIFEKPSLRTRATFEIGMFQLGGSSIYFTPEQIQLGVREDVADIARNLERWVDGIVARTFAHDTVVELARNSSKPVINGLTDRVHPCQIMSDLLTIKEHLGRVEDLKLAFIGDGNNVANSWVNAVAKLDFSLCIATPPGYEPDKEIFERAKLVARDRLSITDDPVEAVHDADAVYTDVWASMGQEDEAEARKRIFEAYQVNSELLANAKSGALVMHCLPAHRGEEITSDVLDGPNSVVYDQAENRLHMQKAIMVRLMRQKKMER
jgi:ornithine carbamoyltransferase